MMQLNDISTSHSSGDSRRALEVVLQFSWLTSHVRSEQAFTRSGPCLLEAGLSAGSSQFGHESSDLSSALQADIPASAVQQQQQQQRPEAVRNLANVKNAPLVTGRLENINTAEPALQSEPGIQEMCLPLILGPLFVGSAALLAFLFNLVSHPYILLR